ncbi:MAG: sigma-70 family RNA polymerase sigma factor [bacterium]
MIENDTISDLQTNFGNMTNWDDLQLIEEYLKTKSDAAANILMRRHQKFVYSVAYRYLNDYDEADEVTQETFIIVFRSLDKFNGKSKLRTWLYRITANNALSFKRKYAMSKLFVRDDTEEYMNIPTQTGDALQTIENENFKIEFEKALGKLPKKQRETFALRYFEKLPYDEISEMLGTTVGGLKANYFQAIKKLAVFMKDYSRAEL